MRRINFAFAAVVLVVLAALVGGFVGLHAVQAGRIAADIRWQAEKARDEGRTDDAIRYAAQYLEFRPDDVGVLSDLAEWLRDRAKTYKQYAGVLGLYERILRAAPGDAATRLKAAKLASDLWSWTQALDNLDILLADRPDDPELCERYGYCQQMVGKYDEAARWYRKALQADPKRVSAYLQYAGLLYHNQRRPDEALKVAEQAVAANPGSATAHAGLAQYLRAADRLRDATAAVRTAQKLATGADGASVLLVAAEVEQANGNLDAARTLLETGNRKFPKNTRFTCSLAWLQLYDGHPDRAVATLRAGKAANPKDVDVLTLLGDLLAQDGQVGPLEETLKELTDLNAPAERVQYVEARLLMRRGRYADAAAKLDALRTAAQRSPNLYRQANHLLAQCHAAADDAAGELDAYRRLLDHDPTAGTVRLEYARALARRGKPADARREFLAVLARPEVSSRAVADTARALIAHARRDPAAWAELQKVIDGLKLDDANPNPVVARAALDLARRRPADSLPAVERALAKLSTNVALHVARVALTEPVFGQDRAMTAVADAETVFGDHAELRAARARLLGARLDPAAADALAGLARGLERFGAEDRTQVLREVIAAFRGQGDAAAVAQHLDLLAQLRPDDLATRAALYALALRAGDESRCQAVLRGVEVIEGKDGPTAQVLEAQRLLWQGAPPAEVAVRLDAAAQARPGDPEVEFLRGRVAELAGRGPDALKHYRAAFDRGLADRPVEELFATLAGKSAAAPVAVLRDQVPLADRLSPDRSRSLVVAALPLYDAAALAKLAERLAADAATDAGTMLWLGRVFARRGMDQRAETAFRQTAAVAPASPDGWQALVAHRAARKDAAGTQAAIAEVRGKLTPIEANITVGKALEAARDFDGARHAFEAALALKPDDTRSLKLLANLHVKADRPDEARKVMETLAALPAPSVPDDARWARRTLAVQLAASPAAGSLPKALTLLDANKVNGKLPDEDQRRRVLVLAAQRGRPLPGAETTGRQEAIRTLEGLARQRSARSADDLLMLAKLYRAENDEAKARATRERMRAEHPAHFGCVAYLAREALRDHDLPACEALLPALRRLGGGQFEAAAVEFQYRVLAGTHDLGRRALDDFVAAGAGDADRSARGVRAADLVFDFLQAHPLDNRPEAAADLRALAARLYRPAAGRDPQAFQRLVTVLAQADRVPEALVTWQRSKKTFGPEVAAAAYVQVLRYGKGVDDAQTKAIGRFLADALAVAPRSTALRLSQAEFFGLTGEHEQAVRAYRAVLATEPDNVVALNNLAWTLSADRKDRAKVEESLAHIQRAIDLAGPVDELLDTKARILFESGRQEDGLRDMREAVTEAPSAARWLHYATMLRRAGRAEQAERALAEAKRFGLAAATH